MNEIIFYGVINEFSVASFIQRLQAAEGQDIDVLLNSQGGDVSSGWGMIKRFRDFGGNKKVTVHGAAHSMASMFILFADEVTAIKQSKFVLHRASAFFIDATMRELLISINEDVRAAMEEKLDIEAFEDIAGVDLDRFFDVDQERIDVILNSEQAEAIGLIKNVVNLSPNQAERINRNMVEACHGVGVEMLKVDKPAKKKNKSSKNSDSQMDLNELKTKHPELYKQVMAQGEAGASEEAKKAELDRVNAWMAWHEVDPKAVMEGIKSGEPITMGKISEFSAKAAKNGFSASLESQTGDGPDTEESDDDGDGDGGDGDQAKAKANAQFEKEIRQELNLKTEDK